MPKKDITTDDVTSLAKNLLINRLPVVNVGEHTNKTEGFVQKICFIIQEIINEFL